MISQAVGIRLDQMAMRSHVMQAPVLIKERLVAQRAVAIICGFNLQGGGC